jgi:hypothetical protein
MRTAYEDMVNQDFVEEVGAILAEANADTYPANQGLYIGRLIDLYEQKIDELPDV